MRVEITDEVVGQLAALLDADAVEQPVDRTAVQFAAQDAGSEALATFVFEADAATYYEALQRAAERADADVDLP